MSELPDNEQSQVTPGGINKPSTATDYIKGIKAGNRVVLGKAITLIESTRPDHQELAQHIIEGCLAFSGESIRIGVTGSPGVGKSTFIESLGQLLIKEGHKVAVLAIDPSSQLSKGSILGDKTRMQQLSASAHSFIRPSPAGTSLGGVAQRTRETIILCEAAGYQHIIIETVGVGQSETLVHSMVDFFLLLLLPGAGDELQGIKRGIVEMADLIAINKAEGDRIPLAKQAKQEYRNALHLYPPKVNGWQPKVVLCSALESQGILEIWQLIQEFHRFTSGNDYFHQNRQNQRLLWLQESLQQELLLLFHQEPAVRQLLSQLKADVLAGQITPFRAAKQLIQLFLTTKETDQ